VKSFLFDNIQQWTNKKAWLAGAGSRDGKYPDFVAFDTQEIRTAIGIYVLQGLSLSPRVEYKP